MHVVLVVLAYVVMIGYEVPGILRRKERGELAAFAFLVLAAFTLSILLAMGAPVPNPIEGIEFLTGRLARLIG